MYLSMEARVINSTTRQRLDACYFYTWDALFQIYIQHRDTDLDALVLLPFDQLPVFDEYARHEEMATFCTTTTSLGNKINK